MSTGGRCRDRLALLIIGRPVLRESGAGLAAARPRERATSRNALAACHRCRRQRRDGAPLRSDLSSCAAGTSPRFAARPTTGSADEPRFDSMGSRDRHRRPGLHRPAEAADLSTARDGDGPPQVRIIRRVRPPSRRRDASGWSPVAREAPGPERLVPLLDPPLRVTPATRSLDIDATWLRDYTAAEVGVEGLVIKGLAQLYRPDARAWPGRSPTHAQNVETLRWAVVPRSSVTVTLTVRLKIGLS